LSQKKSGRPSSDWNRSKAAISNRSEPTLSFLFVRIFLAFLK
jgi:hypothetical protein